MGRERWGTFSVRDHTLNQPFAADVLMYDRLVIPRPADSIERGRWSVSGWEPDRLDSILAVLRTDGDEKKRHAITVDWNHYTEDLFNQRARTARILDEEANYGLSRRLLATELAPPAPSGVIPVNIVAAYPSVEAAEAEWTPNDDQNRRETLTIALAHQFLVPAADGRTDIELLQDAVDLADDSDFRNKREQMYQWQEEIIRTGISDAQALEEMAQYVAEYRDATQRATRKVYIKFAFTLVPITLSALGGPLTPFVGAGGIANLVRFWIFDRKPLISAGKSEAAAMFHTIQQELGWRTA